MSQFQRNFLADSININPTVRPIDTFVQAQRKGVAGAPIGPNPATQIAQALGRFDQSLHKYYFEPQHQKMIKEQESNAQQLARQYENFNAFSAAVDKGEIEHGDNPYLQLFAKELYAKEGANELSIRIAELSDRKDLLGADDPVMAFDQAVEELRADILGESPDIYFAQAFDRHSSPVISRGANQYAQGLRRFNVEEAVTAYRKNLNTELNKIYEQLAVGDDVSIEAMAAEITNSLDQVKNANLIPDNMRNQMVVSELSSLAEGLSHDNPIAAESVVRILEGVGTGPGSVLVSKSHALQLRERIDRNAELREKEKDAEDARKEEENWNKALGLTFEFKGTDKFSDTAEGFFNYLGEEASYLTNDQRNRMVNIWRTNRNDVQRQDELEDARLDEEEREQREDKRRLLTRQSNEIIDDIKKAPPGPQKLEAVLTAMEFSSDNPDLKEHDDLYKSVIGEVQGYYNRNYKEAADALASYMNVEVQRVVDTYKQSGDFLDASPEKLSTLGKEILAYTKFGQQQMLQNMFSEGLASAPPTPDQIKEAASEIIETSIKEMEKRRDLLRQTKAENTQAALDLVYNKPSFQAGQEDSNHKASRAEVKARELRDLARAASSAAERDRLIAQAESQERLAKKEVIRMQGELLSFLGGMTTKKSKRGTVFQTRMSIKEAHEYLTEISLTRESGPRWTRDAYIAYLDFRDNYPDHINAPDIDETLPKGGFFDPIKHQWVDNEAHWNAEVREFRKLLDDPESATRFVSVSGSLWQPEANPRTNILYRLHQNHPEWKLDQPIVDGAGSEMMEMIRAAQTLLIQRGKKLKE